MKEKVKWQCEFCNTEFTDKKSAEVCESSHKTIISIIGKKYLPIRVDRTGYPSCVEIKMSDGSTVKYRR